MVDDTRETMPIDDLIGHALKEIGEFNDGTNGYEGGEFDSTSGVLTLRHNAGEPISDSWKEANEFEDFTDTAADFVELGAVVKIVKKLTGGYTTEAALDLIAEILDHGRMNLHPES
jgi:hypothetical protein